MSSRGLVVQHIQERMTRAFANEQLADAQNLACFLDSLEEFTDGEYDAWVNEAEAEQSGAIS